MKKYGTLLAVLGASPNGDSGGRCPECWQRPGDLRFVQYVGHGEPAPEPDWSPDDFCNTCGRIRGIRLVEGSKVQPWYREDDHAR